MLRAFYTTLIFALLFALSSCIADDENDFDFEDKGFYYGCVETSDCVNPDEADGYVCCYDKVNPEAEGACQGRCLPSAQCNGQDENSEIAQDCRETLQQ